MARRVSVQGASGAGKTEFAARLAGCLGVPHIELDALHHGPNWTEATSAELTASVSQAMAANPAGWVIDGNYHRKIGTLVSDAADTVVWLDPPLPVLLWRLWRRTSVRIVGRVELWNGNRESWRGAFWGRESLFAWTIRSYFRHRRDWPSLLGGHPGLVRLRSSRLTKQWLSAQCVNPGASSQPAARQRKRRSRH
jgi:adenylate kinase family enzyme